MYIRIYFYYLDRLYRDIFIGNIGIEIPMTMTEISDDCDTLGAPPAPSSFCSLSLKTGDSGNEPNRARQPNCPEFSVPFFEPLKILRKDGFGLFRQPDTEATFPNTYIVRAHNRPS